MLPLGGDHRDRGRYRGRDRNRFLRTNRADCDCDRDCDCDCDPDTDPDVSGFLRLFSKQSLFSPCILESVEVLPAKREDCPQFRRQSSNFAGIVHRA